MDSPAANEAVVETTRRLRPDVTLVARARDADHARALYQLGATDAVPETIEASLQLSEAVLVDVGVPMGLVIASIHEKRDEFRKILAAAGAPERPRSNSGTATGVSGAGRVACDSKAEGSSQATAAHGLPWEPAPQQHVEARRRRAGDVTFAELARRQTSAGHDLALEAVGDSRKC